MTLEQSRKWGEDFQRELAKPNRIPGLLNAIAAITTPVPDKTIVQPERFLYYNLDGSLVTVVIFNEEGVVANVTRGPVKMN